jgi:hypothetical protein
MSRGYLYIGAGIGAALVVGLLWYVFSTSGAAPSGTGGITNFFSGGNNQTVGTPVTQNETPGTSLDEGIDSTTKIFKIADGPIAGAAFYLGGRPTTTIMRYIKGENGHVFDVVIDTPGAIAKAISNTTIPGSFKALWSPGAGNTLLQYIDANIIKTVRLGFPTVATSSSTSTASQVVRVQFFPSNITSFALSPDGRSVVYLIPTGSGTDGYTSGIDGSNPKKLFSMPLRQLQVSWPSQSTLLLQTNASVGVPGMLFTVITSSGAVSPLIYGEGITAIANQSLSRLVYQKIPQASERSTFVYDVASGLNKPLSFSPYPEKCAWGTVSTTTLYCGTPLLYVPNSYLDMWYQGRATAADTIVTLQTDTTQLRELITPGAQDGGSVADIIEIGVSPNEEYLYYITKGDRSLWGVRLK